MKKRISIMLIIAVIFTCFGGCITALASDDAYDGENNIIAEYTALDSAAINAKSAVLMEATTGTLLYAKNPNEALPPASVTKIMTLLLVAEAIDEERISLTDKIFVSANAASMGGSQIFLKEGEEFTVEELLKSTVIASANDAAVALGEHIAGSEAAFIDMMNKRAAELGMKNTHFENATGLDDDVTNHLTSAYDIALMSRELISHDVILKYSNIWQDTVRNGEFTLTNTNRLVRYYSGCTGLKTGSTDKAGFCISATAERDGMHLIAVIMGSDTRDERNNSARALLDFGFANYSIYRENEGPLEDVSVLKGKSNKVTVCNKGFSVLIEKADAKRVEKTYNIPESINAPIKEGEVVGEVIYTIDGRELGSSDIYVMASVEKIGPIDLFCRMLLTIILGKQNF